MQHFSNELIVWYELNKRDLPWRHTKNPYHIWVSEIMLQQTQAQTVIPYYNRFIHTLKTIKDLAEADEDTLLKLWEGLGYYSRVRNMQKTAIDILKNHNGKFPNDYESIIKLKGIGTYTAGAILSIAFDKPYSALDGNVSRVISRLYAIESDISSVATKNTLNALNQSLIDKNDPATYTQAIIELGAIQCVKSNPKCALCPVQSFCKAYKEHKVDIIPFKKKLKEKKIMYFQTLILQDEMGKYYVYKNNENLLKGLYLLPQFEAEHITYAIDHLESLGIEIYHQRFLNHYKHIFTHLVWEMDLYLLKIKATTMFEAYHDFSEVPMATAHKFMIEKEGLYGKS